MQGRFGRNRRRIEMPGHRHLHRREIDADEVALIDLEDIWPVFSDIGISIVLFLTFALIAQLLEISQVFDDLARQKSQKTLLAKLTHDPFFQRAIQNKDITIESQGSSQRFRFSEEILFLTGDDTIQPRGEAVLTRFARFICRNAPSEVTIEVEGHTDRVPIHNARCRDNWELSAQRSLAVVRLFLGLSDQPGTGVSIKPTRISAIGYGEFHPIEDRVASALNRRVEIRLDYGAVKAKRQSNGDSERYVERSQLKASSFVSGARSEP